MSQVEDKTTRVQEPTPIDPRVGEIGPAPFPIRLIAALTRRLPRGKHYVVEWLCRGSGRRFIARLPNRLGGFTFDCSLRDQLARAVYFAGSFEAPEVALLRETLQPGMSFVDVGANWGLFSLLAAMRVGPTGKVFAFEPDRRMFQLLRENIERNQLAQVRIFNLAVGDRAGEMVLAAHDPSSENWGISRLVTQATTQTQFSASCRALDEILDEAGVENVDLVKIDVEGAEDLVLQGMLHGLQGRRYRRILLELHPSELGERGRTMADVIAVLSARGYRGEALDHSPTGVRRAFYHPMLPSARYVKPLEEGLRDSHPHTIWTAPDEVTPSSTIRS